MILVTYASIAVSGCIETLSFRHVTAKQALLGESESEVLACAGPPRTVSSLDGLRAGEPCTITRREDCSKDRSWN